MNPVSLILPVLQFAWGILVKYHPKLAKVPNGIIPWTNALAAFIVAIAQPAPAGASTLPLVPLHIPVILGFWGGLGHFLVPILQAGWEAAQVSIFYEFFGRAPADAILKAKP